MYFHDTIIKQQDAIKNQKFYIYTEIHLIFDEQNHIFMTNPITLSAKTDNGHKLEAVFLPNQGMALASYTCNEIEIIDQGTKGEFEKNFAGLGPLIGPHFYMRNVGIIPSTAKEFYNERKQSQPSGDPFCHGIARYANWKAKVKDQTIYAELSGKDTLEGTPLSSLQGQDFKIRFDVILHSKGLKLHLSIVSETDSLVGIHYYYSLGKEKAHVTSKVQEKCILGGTRTSIPWERNAEGEVKILLNGELDHDIECTFFPYPNPLEGEILLETSKYRLITRTKNPSQEHCWQLWYPKGSSFVCIEPMSAQDPHHPNLTVSQIEIDLEPF